MIINASKSCQNKHQHTRISKSMQKPTPVLNQFGINSFKPIKNEFQQQVGWVQKICWRMLRSFREGELRIDQRWSLVKNSLIKFRATPFVPTSAKISTTPCPANELRDANHPSHVGILVALFPVMLSASWTKLMVEVVML